MATMQIILRADVDTLGRLGEIVTVKAGYGRNFLIPQGLAMLATESNKRVFENERKKLQVQRDSLKAAAEALAAKITAAVVTVEVRVGEGDRLYGSVTSADICAALSKLIGEEVDRKLLLLEAPIKALGKYEVAFKLHPDVTATTVVKVYRQGGSAADLDEPEAPAAEAPAAAPEADAAAE